MKGTKLDPLEPVEIEPSGGHRRAQGALPKYVSRAGRPIAKSVTMGAGAGEDEYEMRSRVLEYLESIKWRL